MNEYKQVKDNFRIDEHQRISNIARSENITIAQCIRNHFDSSIDNPPIRNQTVSYKKVDPKLLFQIEYISKQLHYIAKNLQGGGELERFLLVEIYEKMMEITK